MCYQDNTHLVYPDQLQRQKQDSLKILRLRLLNNENNIIPRLLNIQITTKKRWADRIHRFQECILTYHSYYKTAQNLEAPVGRKR